MKPKLCMIFEAIGPFNAIGKIAMAEVEIALEAGWEVTVVAKLLDESLRDRVEWIKLYCPSRGFILQWTTARYLIRRALGARQFDVVHAHQPQVADLADVFQCHYLTRWAHEKQALRSGLGLRSHLNAFQQLGAMYQEDHFYSHWNPKTRMLFNSSLTADAFDTFYDIPARSDVLCCTINAGCPSSDADRRAARAELVGGGGEDGRIVLGYLGGLHLRKGYRLLLDALGDCAHVTCLFGGKDTEGFVEPGLEGRLKGLGLVDDLDQFYSACDVFIVPSLFEPFGLVAYEAASRGVPVIATEGVGAMGMLLEYGAGVCWNPADPLEPVIEEVVANRGRYQAGIRKMCAEQGNDQFRDKLLEVYQEVLDEKGVRSIV